MGLAWFDGAWWSCMAPKLARFDPVSLDITLIDTECVGLARIGNQLAVNLDGGGPKGIDLYDTGTQALQGLPVASPNEPWQTLVQGASDGTSLWDGWTADFLNQYDLATGAHLYFDLEDYDDIVVGVGYRDGSLWVLDNGVTAPDHRIRVQTFDAVTGAAQGAVAIGAYGTDTMQGLWCGVP